MALAGPCLPVQDVVGALGAGSSLYPPVSDRYAPCSKTADSFEFLTQLSVDAMPVVQLGLVAPDQAEMVPSEQAAKWQADYDSGSDQVGMAGCWSLWAWRAFCTAV